MPQPDPWSLAQDFINNLNSQAEKNRYQGFTAQQSMNRSMIDRQDASWLNQQKLLADETDFQQQLIRDDADMQFRHNENYLKENVYGGGGGSKSRFATQSATGPGAMPAYQSPYGTTSSTTQAPTVDPMTGDVGLGADHAFNYYLQQGVPRHVAAAIVANLDAESSFAPDVWSGQRRGDDGSAAYAGQWRGERQANLIRFAQSRGHQQPTNKDQLDFYIYEGTSGLDAGAAKAFQLAQQASSPEEAANIIMTHFERPSADPRENQIGHRQRFARQIFETGGNGGGTQVSPDSAQRRYIDPSHQPDTGTMPVEPPFEQRTSGASPLEYDAEHVWTDEELTQFLTPDEVAAVKKRGDAVGSPRNYSELGYNNLPPEIRDNLVPMWKKDQYGPSEYLYVRPPQAEVTEDGLDTGEATPSVTTAPNVEIQTTNPKTPEGSENVKQIDGVWHTYAGGKWVRME